jgi:hypothetical protein
LEIEYYSNESIEYLTRELGWNWNPLCRLDSNLVLAQVDKIRILCVGQNPHELRRIDKFPLRSIWVLLYSDETLDPTLNKVTLSHPSVCGVIRHYPCKSSSPWKRIQKLTQSIKLNEISIHEVFSMNLLASLASSYVLTRRMSKVKRLHSKSKIVSVHLYLGYTNLFAKSYEKLMQDIKGINLNRTESLLEKSEEFVFDMERIFQISFSGQKGKFWRAKAIREFEYWSSLNPTTKMGLRLRDGFGGTLGANEVTPQVGIEYVRMLLSSRFALCPPGNYSIYTFRFLESILSGAMPMICLPCPSDPLNNYDELKPSVAIFGTWSHSFSYAHGLSERRRRELLRGLSLQFQQHLADVNGRLFRQSEQATK